MADKPRLLNQVREIESAYTRIALKPIDEPAWTQVITELGGQAAYVSRLLLNEMPDTIEGPLGKLGLHLLPRHAKDLATDCSCPDWQNPCKHVAGLYYLLAAKLDQDPFLLFELRGLPRKELLAQLRNTPLGRTLADALSEAEAPAEAVESFFTRPLPESRPLTNSFDAFWRGRKRLPETIEPAQPPAVPALLIKKGGDYPASGPATTLLSRPWKPSTKQSGRGASHGKKTVGDSPRRLRLQPVRPRLEASTWLRRINQRDWPGASGSFDDGSMAAGKCCRGRWREGRWRCWS